MSLSPKTEMCCSLCFSLTGQDHVWLRKSWQRNQTSQEDFQTEWQQFIWYPNGSHFHNQRSQSRWLLYSVRKAPPAGSAGCWQDSAYELCTFQPRGTHTSWDQWKKDIGYNKFPVICCILCECGKIYMLGWQAAPLRHVRSMYNTYVYVCFFQPDKSVVAGHSIKACIIPNSRTLRLLGRISGYISKPLLYSRCQGKESTPT
jgi:hypothetical protein